MIIYYKNLIYIKVIIDFTFFPIYKRNHPKFFDNHLIYNSDSHSIVLNNDLT
jgi:hypothetical protein